MMMALCLQRQALTGSGPASSSTDGLSAGAATTTTTTTSAQEATSTDMPSSSRVRGGTTRTLDADAEEQDSEFICVESVVWSTCKAQFGSKNGLFKHLKECNDHGDSWADISEFWEP